MTTVQTVGGEKNIDKKPPTAASVSLSLRHSWCVEFIYKETKLNPLSFYSFIEQLISSITFLLFDFL